MYATTRYNFVRLKATHKISPLEELVGGRSPPRAPTTFKLEGEVTSLSESSQGEVGDNREKWGDFWEILPVNLWELLGGDLPPTNSSKGEILCVTFKRTKLYLVVFIHHMKHY
jgi:hypothetical protein